MQDYFFNLNNPLYQLLNGPENLVMRTALIVLLGVCVGSFLNVIAHRSLTEQSWIFKRSHCPKCKHNLSFLDLVPIVSYLVLKGKCHYCKESISWQYPFVEFITGILFFVVFSLYGLTIQGLAMTYFGCMLIAVCITDFKEKLIPHEITYPSMIVGIIYRSFFHTEPIQAWEGGIKFDCIHTTQTLSHFGFHPDLFFNTLAGIGISYIVFDYIDFYGLVMLKFIQGGEEDEEEENEEVDEQIDINFDIKEKEYNEEDNIVMGGGDAVLSAVIASFLGLQGMAVSVFLAFLVGSVMGAVYLFVDMKKRHVLHTIKKPALVGFILGASLLTLPLLAFGMMVGSLDTFLSTQLLTLALSGGVAGSLISAIFSGSRFQARFPFGPSLAIGAAFAMFVNVPSGLTNLLIIFNQASTFQ